MSRNPKDLAISDEPVSDDESPDTTPQEKKEDPRQRPWEGFWPPPAGETGYQYGVLPGQIITIQGN